MKNIYLNGIAITAFLIIITSTCLADKNKKFDPNDFLLPENEVIKEVTSLNNLYIKSKENIKNVSTVTYYISKDNSPNYYLLKSFFVDWNLK